MTRLRAAVVGVGHLGQHHARILAAMPEIDLVAVVDPRLEQAQAVAARCQTIPMTDYRTVLDAVDLVVVAVPTVLHREVAGAFLERGVATLVEKPMAPTAAEAEDLVRLARASGAVLQVGHIERFNPALAALDEYPIRPRYVTSERMSMYTFRSTDVGVVLDLMIHDIDLVLSMIPAAVRSTASVGVSLFGEHEDVANARIEFEDGSVANLSASRASYTPQRKMRIWGAEGYASLDLAAREATIVRPSEQLARGRIDLDGVDLGNPAAVKEHLFGKVFRVDRQKAESKESLALELEDFVRAAQGLSRPRVSGEEALRAVRLAEQILSGLESHRWQSEPVAPEPVSVLRGPHAWRKKGLRPGASVGQEPGDRLERRSS